MAPANPADYVSSLYRAEVGRVCDIGTFRARAANRDFSWFWPCASLLYGVSRVLVLRVTGYYEAQPFVPL